MEIINFGNLSTKVANTKIFMGASDGIQRYDRFKYHISDKLVKVQQASIWFPKEISYSKDMVGITVLPANHAEVYTLNLMSQTVADSYANRHLDNVLANYITSPEWERVIKWQALFELIHSEAYSENIRKVFTDAEAIFNKGLANPKIHNRLKVELDAYKQFQIDINSESELVRKQAIVRECILQYALENLRFMISFLYTYVINEQNNQVMQGSVNNITLILNDETIHTTIFKHLLLILRDNDDEEFSHILNSAWFHETIKDVFEKVIESELEWFNYLDSIAHFDGIGSQQAKEFLEFYAYRALRNINEETNYEPVRNELVQFFESKRNINGIKSLAQETEVLSYNIGVLDDANYDSCDVLEFLKEQGCL